jgi:Mg-chelatase subunit ChlD
MQPRARVLATGLLAVAGLLGLAGLTRGASAQAPLPTEGYRLADTWLTRDPVNSVAKFEKPVGLAVAADDNVYIADARLKQVYQLANGGQVVRKWDVDARVGTPIDVTVSSDRVYVVGDAGGEVRSRAGALIRTFTVSGARGVAIGPDRRLFVSRVGQVGGQPTGLVDVRDVDGNVLGAPWQDPTFPMRAVFGLDVGPNGRVYLAADGAVYVLDDGRVTALLRVRAAIEGPDVVDVSVDSAGRVFAILAAQTGMVIGWNGVVGTAGSYMGDALLPGAKWLAAGPGAGMVVSLDAPGFIGVGYLPARDDLKGQILVPQRWGEAGDSLGLLDGPRRVSVAAGGDVYLVDRLERVQRWSVAGVPQEQWDATQVADVAGGGTLPCFIRGEALTCLAPARSVLWERAAPSGSWLTALAGSATHLAAVDLANQRLLVYERTMDPAGPPNPTSWAIGPAGTFTAVTDVAVDGQTVYLVNHTERRVDLYNLDGQAQGTIDVPNEALRVAAAGGAVYALSRDGWIYKYDAAGTLKAAFEAVPNGKAGDLGVEPGGRVYVTDFHTDRATNQPVSRVLVYEPGGNPPGQLPPEADRDCVVEVDKQAAPDQVFINEEVTVQLEVTGRCNYGGGELDVALIIDQSGSMPPAAIAAAQAAAVTFVTELDPKGAQVSLVVFSSSATTLVPLTRNLSDVVRAVSRIQAGGTTQYAAGMSKALTELTGPAARPGVPKIVVMMTDGNPTDRPDVQPMVDRLKSAGLNIFTIGLGNDLDRDLLRQVASDPSQFYEAPTESQLSEVYASIARRIGATKLLKTGTVVDELPADMSLVAGSVLPDARLTGRTLTWDLVDVPITGLQLSYRVKPTQAGLRPTNVRATLDYVDSTTAAGTRVFPVPEVMVIKRTRLTAYLPYLSKNRCRPQRADVVLVFDTSNSMLEPAQPGSAQTKLQAAQAAGRSFLDQMVLPGDQASIVAFNTGVSTPQRLTGSRAALLSALAGLRTNAGTRIDLGLNAAEAELLSSRHQRSNTPVIVLLTDGRPSGTTDEKVIRAGRNARANGFQLFAIGLGDADMDLLRFVAGDSKRSFYAPTGAALQGIYASIAGAALCD